MTADLSKFLATELLGTLRTDCELIAIC